MASKQAGFDGEDEPRMPPRFELPILYPPPVINWRVQSQAFDHAIKRNNGRRKANCGSKMPHVPANYSELAQ